MNNKVLTSKTATGNNPKLVWLADQLDNDFSNGGKFTKLL